MAVVVDGSGSISMVMVVMVVMMMMRNGVRRVAGHACRGTILSVLAMMMMAGIVRRFP